MAVWPARIAVSAQRNQILASRIDEWRKLGDWARANTDQGAIFLVPVFDLLNGQRGKPANPITARPVYNEIFEFQSHRRVWVDYKRGAAVMWTPSYFREWRTRLDQVSRLPALSDRLGYAAANGIGYVIDFCAPADRGVAAAFSDGNLCVYRVEAAAG